MKLRKLLKAILPFALVIFMFQTNNTFALDDSESRFYTETWNNGVSRNIITDYGAIINDGQDDSQAVQKAIDELTNQPNGGRINFPRGTYHIKFVRLKSNVHLVFAAGSIIKIPPNDNKWGFIFDAGDQEKVENISIRGNGGRFTIDIRTAQPNELLTVFRLSNASNFYIAEVNVLDNYTKFPALATGRGYQNGTTKNGIFKNATLTNAHYGFGMVQTGAAKTILFKNLDGGGGVTLRLETAITGVTIDDIVARNIISRKGHAAVFVSPHHITGGTFDIHDVKSYGSGFAVRIERGFGNPRGTFNSNSKINKIYAEYGTNAQIRSDHVNYLPCQLKHLAVENTVVDLGTAQTSYTAPSMAPILYEQGSGDGYYNVALTNVTKSGFTYQSKTIINVNDKVDEADCDNNTDNTTCGNNAKAWIYQHCSYGGYSVALNEGSYNLSQLQNCGLTNDDASAIKVASGYKITVYQHGSFAGFSTSFTSDIGCLNGQTGGRTDGKNWNDDISSVKVEPVSGSSSSSSGGTAIHMKKRNSTGFAIDGGNGGANGQNLYLWSSNTDHVNQKWEEIDRGGGYYSYKKVNTNFCIDGGNGGANGQNVYLWTCSDGNQNQHWKKVDAGSGNYRLEKRNASSFSIDGGNGGANSQNIYLWTTNHSNQNQHWQFSSVLKSAEALFDKRVSTKLEIYPNPATDELNISLSNKLSENAQVMIYNTMGKTIVTQKLLDAKHQLSISNLSSGMYILQVINGNEIITERFIKE